MYKVVGTPAIRGKSKTWTVLVVAVILVVISAASDARRFLRVESNGSWGGASQCQGSGGRVRGPVNTEVGLDLNSIDFSGSRDPAFSTSFCEQSNPFVAGATSREYFNAGNIEFRDPLDVIPAGIATLIDSNTDNKVQAHSSNFQSGFNGFQWVFLTFPDDVTLVRFRGVVDDVLTPDGFTTPDVLPLSSQTSIRKGSTVFFQGNLWPDYNDEFFCFKGQEYLGVWDEVNATLANPLPGCAIENAGHPPFEDTFDKRKVAAVVSAVSSTLLAEDCPIVPAINLGETKLGNWESNDRRSFARANDELSSTAAAPADDYLLQLATPTTVQITLTSTADTFLYLRNRCDPRSNPLEGNDDFSGLPNTLNSRITISLQAGEYWVEATTFGSNVVANYELDIQTIAP